MEVISRGKLAGKRCFHVLLWQFQVLSSWLIDIRRDKLVIRISQAAIVSPLISLMVDHITRLLL